jgi:hypothetical protein
MPDIDVLSLGVATVAAFFVAPVYYAVFGGQLATAGDAAATDGRPPPWKLAVELLRCLLIAAVVTGLVSQGEIDGWRGGLLLGLALWFGFPFVLWTGAMIWDNEPWRRAAVHAGDWLVKLVVVALIASLWPWSS